MDKRDDYNLITKNYVKSFIKKRERDVHKGDCGKILIIAGSKGMAGAAVLCALAALRSGAGLVRVSIDSELFTAIHAGLPEATCIDREASMDNMMQYDAIAIGPGLGTDHKNDAIIMKALQCSDMPIIIDADALNMLSSDLNLMKNAKAKLIITPHPGEAARLLNVKTAGINNDRVGFATKLAAETGAITILKGFETIVATPEGKIYINTTGNPGMATGGSGDVLTGIIASLAGQGIELEKAAVSGVYLHGLAGDIMAEKIGEYGLIASDIAKMAAVAIKNTIDEK